MIFADFHEICSDFRRFSRKTLQLLEISRFQFNFSMIILRIHLIFDSILFGFRFNFRIGTTPASARRPPGARRPRRSLRALRCRPQGGVPPREGPLRKRRARSSRASAGRGTYVKIKSLGGVNMVKLNKL